MLDVECSKCALSCVRNVKDTQQSAQSFATDRPSVLRPERPGSVRMMRVQNGTRSHQERLSDRCDDASKVGWIQGRASDTRNGTGEPPTHHPSFQREKDTFPIVASIRSHGSLEERQKTIDTRKRIVVYCATNRNLPDAMHPFLESRSSHSNRNHDVPIERKAFLKHDSETKRVGSHPSFASHQQEGTHATDVLLPWHPKRFVSPTIDSLVPIDSHPAFFVQGSMAKPRDEHARGRSEDVPDGNGTRSRAWERNALRTRHWVPRVEFVLVSIHPVPPIPRPSNATRSRTRGIPCDPTRGPRGTPLASSRVSFDRNMPCL